MRILQRVLLWHHISYLTYYVPEFASVAKYERAFCAAHVACMALRGMVVSFEPVQEPTAHSGLGLRTRKAQILQNGWQRGPTTNSEALNRTSYLV
jgi:hypothetical protein